MSLAQNVDVLSSDWTSHFVDEISALSELDDDGCVEVVDVVDVAVVVDVDVAVVPDVDAAVVVL